ncbi:hypothetical protein AC792_00075 [Arthrobacter sp. RIT-PI-e]|uniref:hypothetical protein n=1 Tax=Arthrobacter sp. RIT-PI-e TaxID=1681197 RepID=UPI0006769DCA|nr:hypothetical protein [Arthrobacter sp. RIT-PI-e]KNC20514.1 hypothetical protein AC792_00075 [Arthrobacter sp. RIT-PI-e]
MEAPLEEPVLEEEPALEEEPEETPATQRPSPRAAPSATAVAVSVPASTAAPIVIRATADQQVSTRSPVLPAIIVGCVLALAAAGVLAVRRRAL